ncbi:MAG: CRISPR-associated helicase Cas3' [Verrucomicrobiaceae bacterium]|nr:CRISPR-associated helicase Cas3' [Verrucomicrobiaceae bacterium]
MPTDFKAFFTAAFTDQREPYGYQQRLAAEPCISRLINVPTGLGKTAAVILSWLWNRWQPNSTWPRRLVYCLPMRTLVEQTAGEAENWIRNLVSAGLIKGESPKVHILMGGEETEPWDLYPEKDAILIGTQDMLLSRALNRGYGMSRYRWPMHFGLLNNDCLWVLDETQLMGVGVETSAQLDGFRHLAQWLQHGPCPTWWMSATLEDSRLATVDHPAPPGGWPRLVLESKDREAVSHRLAAKKQLHRAKLTITKQTKAAEFAKLVLEKHVEGHLTLVIVNRVQRAQELYEALQKAGRKDNLALVHSRFRSPDRQKHQKVLIPGKNDRLIADRIVVATQAVEAGVDVSARVLITELAPWSSIVQRLGRCNRGGEFNTEGADVHWLDLDFDKDADVAPYTLAELKDARAELEKLEDTSVSPEALSSVKVTPPPVIRPVIRRKDLIDLFDTTPDIAGHDLDISRYIREGDDTDVQVFWRDLGAPDFNPSADTGGPARDELCRVAVYRFQAFLDKLKKANDGRSAYVWDGLREEWKPETRARAGAVYLLDHRAGGYDVQLGWTGEVATLKKESEWASPSAIAAHQKEDSTQRDLLSYTGKPLNLADHTNDVIAETQLILNTLGLDAKWSAPLLTAAQWHDVGKSFKEFQDMLKSAAGDNPPADVLAKSGGRGGSMPPWRKHFRHELASALAWLAHHDGTEQADLIAYVIAAHHGKVRLSIRSLPEEQPPPDRATDLMARGIIDGDELPEVSCSGITLPKTTLRLQLMRMGSDENERPSWLARMIALRDEIGPFALAYLETLLRAADMRASAAEAQAATQP